MASAFSRADLNIVSDGDLRAWYAKASTLTAFTESLGQRQVDGEYLENTIGLPLHLRVVIQGLATEHGGAVPGGALDSIPFYSLCKGLFLPLSGLQPEKTAYLFGLATEAPPDAATREKLLQRFLQQEIGLSAGAEAGLHPRRPLPGQAEHVSKR
jgi:DNA ligase-1